jgi:hypothetical protein
MMLVNRSWHEEISTNEMIFRHAYQTLIPFQINKNKRLIEKLTKKNTSQKHGSATRKQLKKTNIKKEREYNKNTNILDNKIEVKKSKKRERGWKHMFCSYRKGDSLRERKVVIHSSILHLKAEIQKLVAIQRKTKNGIKENYAKSNLILCHLTFRRT